MAVMAFHFETRIQFPPGGQRPGRGWSNLGSNVPTRLVSMTPLPVRWPHALGPVTRNISIVDRPIFSEDDWRIWNLRRTEEEAIAELPHWLCIEKEAEWNDHVILQALADDLRTAVLGFHCGHRLGGRLHYRTEAHGRSTVELVHVPEGYAKPFWGRVLEYWKARSSSVADSDRWNTASYRIGGGASSKPFSLPGNWVSNCRSSPPSCAVPVDDGAGWAPCRRELGSVFAAPTKAPGEGSDSFP